MSLWADLEDRSSGDVIRKEDRMNVISDSDNLKEEELDWAVRHVESKKGALECYARGAYLFKLFGHDKDLSRRMLEAYPKLIE